MVVLNVQDTGGRPRSAPAMAETIKSMRNTKKRILAIPAAAPAIPPNPRTPAMRAIMRKVIVHPNIDYPFIEFKLM